MSNSTVVVVTGVSSGIGRATAERFAKRGCRVFGTVRNRAKAQPITGVELVEMDIRDQASVQQGIQAIIRVQIVLEDPTTLSEGRDFGVLSPQTLRVGTQEAKRALIHDHIDHCVTGGEGHDLVEIKALTKLL